ncbi:hypothetical protein AC579_4537 [Pseudocercospora musae]|uniref:Uncharacterized protein n=1 Tax=Pseudocercospora musae TaxID=113226 RepID=A0A139ITI9_9PEZI|nr:hypothetical protein AC579_4537 [Pseudocercospora musae]
MGRDAGHTSQARNTSTRPGVIWTTDSTTPNAHNAGHHHVSTACNTDMPKLLDPPTSATNRTDALVVDTTRSLTWTTSRRVTLEKSTIKGQSAAARSNGVKHNQFHELYQIWHKRMKGASSTIECEVDYNQVEACL